MLLKKTYLTLSILLFTLVAFAQTDKVDSLRNLLKDSKGYDKLQILFKLSELKENDPQGIEYAKDAVDLSKKLDDKAKSDAEYNLGFVYSSQPDNIKAIERFNKSLEISDKSNYIFGRFRALKGISEFYLDLDSLELSKKISNQLLKLATEKDSIKHQANAYFILGIICDKKGHADSALALITKALELRITIGNQSDIANTYNKIGRLYYDMADYQKSIDCYTNSLKIRESINDPYALAIAYLNFGGTCISIGDYQLALEQFQKALQTFERIGNSEGIAKSCNGIGMVYENLSQSTLAVKDNETNYNKGLEYYKRSLEIFQSLNSRSEVGRSLQNIANVYSRLATNNFVAQYGEGWEESLKKLPSKTILVSFEKSLEYYNKSLEIFKDTQDEAQIANVDINLGATYNWARDWSRANKYLNEALELARKHNLPYEKVNALYSLGESNSNQGNTAQAETYFLECAKMAKDLGIKDTERYCYNRLSKLYEKVGEIQKALDYNKLAVKIKDEIFTEKSQKAITEMQTKYETEKKDLTLNLQDSLIKRQKLTIIGAIIGAVLILLVALLLLKMIKEKQKANRILEEKNELITLQKKEITDSIRYASRIQRAILPSDEILLQTLPQHFVLYLPRDIVSGDFFWLSKRGGKIVIVAADCTGHGVPGAFMSMLGVSFLYEIVNKEGIMEPASILNYLRDHVKHTLSQTGKRDEAKDGMDISLCVFDPNEMKLEWAGAYNPLYLIRNGELIEYKADKMPIAIHMNDHMPFTNNEIALQSGDTFYISSDGYADQFGGVDGRKFMSKKFKEMLLQINGKSMEEQKTIIHNAHMDWKGHHEQVDDILVMGVRV
ncbi:MAG: hypothetical protein EHM93_11465 [Bacteroidales bacterium]|nr:MAG: hypothetical protein EHM93_11465 [Bacteroidales bacterium]